MSTTKKLVLVVVLLVTGFTVGYFSRPKTVAHVNHTCDPHWSLGTVVRIGHSNPITDVYAADEVEVVRILESDGTVQQSERGPNTSPRPEWRVDCPLTGRTYFLISARTNR